MIYSSEVHARSEAAEGFVWSAFPVFLPRRVGCGGSNADSDGDLQVARRRLHVLRIKHAGSPTSLEHVGQQLWAGSFLLCDFVLSHPHFFAGKHVLDLGAGVGLTSLVASSASAHVYCTDSDQTALSLCLANLSLPSNVRVFGPAPALEKRSAQLPPPASHAKRRRNARDPPAPAPTAASSPDAPNRLALPPSPPSPAAVPPVASVRRLDWTRPHLPPLSWLAREEGSAARGAAQELEPLCDAASQASGMDFTEADRALFASTSVLLAADCVFDDDLSQHLVHVVGRLLRTADHVLYATVDKRVVFTVQDLEPVPAAYLFFLQLLGEAGLSVRIWPVDDIPRFFRQPRTEYLCLMEIRKFSVR